MSFPKHMGPLTYHPREPNELRRLNLEQDKGGAMGPWFAGIIAVIVVVTELSRALLNFAKRALP
jgi:hypothetical protein